MTGMCLSVLAAVFGVVLAIIGVEAFPPMHDTIHYFAWYDAVLIAGLTLIAGGAYGAFRLVRK